jgi:serine carboxypeptidase-like clade 2
MNLGRDTHARYEYFWSHGVISDEIGLTIRNVCDFNDFTDDSDSHSVSKSCNKALNETNKIVSGYIDGYDVLLDVCYPAIAEQQIILKKNGTFYFSFIISYSYDIFNK